MELINKAREGVKPLSLTTGDLFPNYGVRCISNGQEWEVVGFNGKQFIIKAVEDGHYAKEGTVNYNTDVLFIGAYIKPSFDFVMALVEKIEKSGWNVTVSGKECVIFDDNFKYTAVGKCHTFNGESKIDAIKKAVSFFFKQYAL